MPFWAKALMDKIIESTTLEVQDAMIQREADTLLEEYNTSDQSSYLHFLKSKFTPELLNDYCSLCISASRNFQIIFSST